MKFFWYDHRVFVKRISMLEGLEKIIEIFDAQPIEFPSSFGEEEGPKLVFAHTGETTGRKREDWQSVAQNGSWVVCLSSLPGQGEMVDSGMYEVGPSCRILASALTEGIVTEFIQTCEERNPNFGLLKARSTENLVALYLFKLWQRDQVRKELSAMDLDPSSDWYREVKLRAEDEWENLCDEEFPDPDDDPNLLESLREVLSRSRDLV